MRPLITLLPILLFACHGTVEEDAQMDEHPHEDVEREVHPPEYYTDSFTATDAALERVPIGDMRMVTIRFEGNDTLRDELVYVLHVDRYVEALMALHVDPGINPHSGTETARIMAIVISTPDFGGPHWHTTTSLQDKDALTEGAMTIRWDIQKVWDAENGWTYSDDVHFSF